MFKKPFLIILTLTLITFLLSPVVVFSEETKPPVEYEAEAPKLQMPIPGVPQFSKIKVEGGELSVPWLAQYIAAVYKYGVALAVSLTIFMLMLGGFLRITAAGNTGKIGKANKLITDAVIGLILALGSYVILYTINPDIVEFKAIQVGVVEKVPWDVKWEASAIDLEPGQETATPAPTTMPSTSEDCKKVSQLVRAGEIGVDKGNDKKGFEEKEGIIKRNACIWCYNGKNEAPGGPCAGEGMDVATDPKICNLLLNLHNAKKTGALKRKIKVNCIICGHSRCSKTEGKPDCDTCKQTAKPNEKAKGESNHWRGSGIDLPPDDELQKYIVDNLLGLGISQVIGPAGWEDYSKITCTQKSPNPLKKGIIIGTARSGKVRSPYNVNNGRSNATYSATTLCGHLNHIHIGF